MQSYRNFNAAVYCPVGNLAAIDDLDGFAERFASLEKHIRVGKVYLETYRGGQRIGREKLLRLKKFFQDKGIETSGGITTDCRPNGEGGFSPRCYTDPESRRELREIVEFTASLFDEIILDDFYFTNCRCESCIAAKGDRSWTDFRLALMEEVSRSVLVGPAKQVNPRVRVIIKYPNWYERYQECGYNLEREPKIFDAVYTGTETRNPQYAQQHLPKYLSYFLMRYMENIAPGRNGGGWFDTFECTYNLTSYAEQAYLTLFAGAREAMLFCLGTLLAPEFSLCAPVAGQVFEETDRILPELGKPTGTACYLPFHSEGEDYLHDYIGMLGIPLEPYPDYPERAGAVFLTESAAKDPALAEKMELSLKNGAAVIVTSGLVAKMGEGFSRFAEISATGRKALVDRFAYSENGGVTFGGCLECAEPILVPQLGYPTNDVWELIAGLGEENSFPLLLKTSYGPGRLYVLTVPEDAGAFCRYPRRLLRILRGIFRGESGILLDAPAKTALFTYDNGTFILRSFQPYYDRCSVTIGREDAELKDLVTGKTVSGERTGDGTRFRFPLPPGVNRIFSIRRRDA